MAKTKVSVCMVVKDEEKFLPQCLKSIHDVPGVHDIIVVDTGSTDKTKEIAQSFPKVKYFYKEFNPWSFKNARNFSIKHAKGNWLMYMDADEVFEGTFPDDLPDVIYNFKIRNLTDGGEYVNSFCARMIPNIKGVEFINDVHEIFASTKKQLPIHQYPHASLVHYGYLGQVREEKNKLQRNLDMLAVAWEEKKSAQNAYYFGQETFITGDYKKSYDLAKEGVALIDHKNSLDLTFEPILYHLLVSAMIEGKFPHEEIEEFEATLAFKRINPEISTALCKYYLERNDPLKAGFYCMQAMKCRNSVELPVKYNENAVKYIGYLMMAEYYHKTVNDPLAALYWLELAHEGGCEDPKILASVYQLLPKYKDIPKLEYYLRKLYEVTKDPSFLKELVNVYMNSNNAEKEIEAVELMNKLSNNEELVMFKMQMIKNGKEHLVDKIKMPTTMSLPSLKDSEKNTTVIIPTMMMADSAYLKWNIDQLNKNKSVEKIIVVDNSNGKFKEFTDANAIDTSKIECFTQENIGFNASVNLGVANSSTPYYMVLNDDCLIRDSAVNSSVNILKNKDDAGVVVINTVPKEPLEEYTSKEVSMIEDIFEEYEPRNSSQYGWCILFKKEDFIEFPKELHTFYGDNLIHYYAWKNHKKTYMLKSNYVSHEISQTVQQLFGNLQDENSDYRKMLIAENEYFKNFIINNPRN